MSGVRGREPFRRGGGIVSVAYRFGEEAPRNRRKVGSRHGVSSRGRHYKREVLPRKVMLGVAGRNTKGAPAWSFTARNNAPWSMAAARFPCPAPNTRNFLEKSREPRLLISEKPSRCISRTLIESIVLGPLRCTVPLSNVCVCVSRKRVRSRSAEKILRFEAWAVLCLI